MTKARFRRGVFSYLFLSRLLSLQFEASSDRLIFFMLASHGAFSEDIFRWQVRLRAQVSAQTMNLWAKQLGCHLSFTAHLQTKMADNNIIAEIINRRPIWKACSLHILYKMF